MKAALLAAVGKLTITEVEQPDLGRPSDVLIRVGAVGICGSEIHAFQGTHPFRKPPSILGHEVAGEVVDVGAKVSGLAPGDRVFVNPQRTCGECEWCQSGRPNVCSSREMLGTLGWTGGLAEYIVAPAQNVCPLPDHVSYVQGTLIEPLCVGVHAIRRAGVEAGEPHWQI